MTRDEVKIWLEKADKDLLGAEHEKAYGEGMIAEHIGFFCQQAVEKYLKAFLVAHRKEFPRTHDLEYLKKICEGNDTDFAGLEFGDLSAFAVDARYPSLSSQVHVTGKELEMYMDLARSVREMVKRKLGFAAGGFES